MGRTRNEDRGLHRLQLKRWRNSATCWVFGERWIFGPWDPAKDKPSPEAESKFLRQVQLWAADPGNRRRESEPLLIELWADWRASPQVPGNRRGEFERIEAALFGTLEKPGPHQATRVSEFGSAELLAWQTALCNLAREDGTPRLGRYSVGRYVNLVKMCFAWGVVVGRLEQSQHATLELVNPPAKGKVKEPVARGSVKIGEVNRTAAKLKSDVGSLLRLLWWTGARPSELCRLTPAMIRKTGSIESKKGAKILIGKLKVWAAQLDEHKTMRFGRERVLFFGPEAQKVLAPLLCREGIDPEAPLFRTADGNAYTSKQLRDYVKKVCRNAGWRTWTPYCIDHAFLSRVQAAFSSEIPGSGPIAAKAARGHSLRGVTEQYAGEDLVTAAKVAAKLG